MLRFIIKRLLLLPLLMLLFTVVVFALVQAPPGDFLTSYVAMLASSGSSMDAARSRRSGSSSAWTSQSTSGIYSGWEALSGGTWVSPSNTSGQVRS